MTRLNGKIAFTLALLCVPSTLHAWGREGHEIVAILAEHRLQPEVREAVTTLLDAASFVEVSMWADHVRTKETAPWHYVNIPIDQETYDSDMYCPKQQCVIGQIERLREVLANPTADFKKRQKALKYLIHFVADLHQPLHAADNGDRGGNDVFVEFFGEKTDRHRNKPWNLHAVWDSGMLEERDAQVYAERLNRWLNSQPEGSFGTGSVMDWAMESHDIAKHHAYKLPEDRKLRDDYYHANVAVVEQQLAKGGVRLAKLLNDTLGSRRKLPRK